MSSLNGWCTRLVMPPLAAAIALCAVVARAQGPYEGTWREGPMNIQVAVTSWGGDCGPRPQSTSTTGGGQFRISQDGELLTFHMGRERTTRGCWSENRAVRRVSSSAQAGTWRIVCRTPAEDSRAETGTYTIQAIGEDQLSFRDVSAYDWQLNESRCVATITTTQNFSRVGAAPRPSTQPEPEPAEPACTAGAPARIVLRPGRVDVPPGAEQCFTARVVDAQGCRVRSARVSLSLAEGSAGAFSGSCYTAPEAEGQARIVARAGELGAEARVEVRTMDLSEWIARRSESGSVGSTVPGEEEDAVTRTAARVSTTGGGELELLWPAVGLAVACLFLVVAAVFFVRRKPKKRGIAGLPGVDLSDAGAPSRPGAAPIAAPPSGEDRGDMICPTCRRGYPPRTTTCDQDATTLVPYRNFVAEPERVNVCPVCGDRFPSNVKFCGKDGSTLEPSPGEP